MRFPQLAVFLILFLLWLGPAPALAQVNANYPPPMSYSHGNLEMRDFAGQMLQGAEFANANLRFANFDGCQLQGSIFSASSMVETNFHGADLTNAMLDLGDLTGADLTNAVLTETILLGSVFDGVKIEGADFSDAILDGAQIKQLCAVAAGVNPTTGVATRDSLGCR